MNRKTTLTILRTAVAMLFAGAFFSDSPFVGAMMYFVGIVIILVCAMLINLLTGYRAKKSYFILELPDYKTPGLKRAFTSMCQRGWSYVVKAGTVILVCNTLVHVMQNFDWSFNVVEEGMAHTSILATIATPFAYVFAPIIGYVSWQLAAATITGFIAKENVVGTLAVCFGLTNLINADELAIESGANVSEIALAFGAGSGGAMIAAAALAYLMLNLFSPPSFAAIGAMRSEINDRKWFFAGIGLQFAVGYSVGFLTYFFGALVTGEGLGLTWATVVGWIFVLSLSALLTVLIIKRQKLLKAEYEAKRTYVQAGT